jgi:hypothetical protein
MTAVRSDTGVEACRSKPMNALHLEEGANVAVGMESSGKAYPSI